MSNKAVIERCYDEVVNRGRLEAIDELTAEDFVDHVVGPDLPPGRAGVRMWFAAFREAVPDLRATVQDVIEEGDRVVARVTFSGTQERALGGIPATGKRFEIEMIDIVRFADGKCVEHWGVMDMAGMMQQLGLMPESAGGESPLRRPPRRPRTR